MNAKSKLRMMCLPVVCAGVILGGCKPSEVSPGTATNAPVAAAVEVNAVHPHRGEIYRYVTLPGEVHPLFQVTLFVKVAGYLENLTVDKGDSVKTGDLIADIEVPELRADKGRQEAELELAAAEFKQISEATNAAATQAENGTLAVAKARLATAKANLAYTETMLSYARVTAPFDGVVTKRFVDPGAFIPAPNAADTPEAAAIVNLTDFKTLRMQVAVPETEVPHIALGQRVEFTTDDLPGERFDGTVTRFYWALDRATKTMLTEVQMPNPDLKLRPGMLVTAKIWLEKKEDALLVPMGALVREKVNTVAYIYAGGTAKKVVVKTGFNDGTNVEVTDGLRPEDPVILTGQQALSDGQPVKLK